MDNLMRKMEAYADVAIKVGVNLQRDQNLYIESNAQAVEFVRVVTERAYAAGARNVFVRLGDEELTRIRLQDAPEEALMEVPRWNLEWYQSILDQDAARLVIVTVNPELLKGIESKRIAVNSRASAEALQFFGTRSSNGEVTWSGVIAPTEAWANAVFPDVPESERLGQLWEMVLRICRADQTNPVAAWQAHLKDLKYHAEYLNQKKYRKFHYRAAGTDLTIEFHEKHQWISGGRLNSRGVPTVPNIPTEEVFTLPLKDSVNGVVKSTKPLNYNGATINNFSLTFKSGKIVSFEAETGYDVLKTIVEMDEGSHFLGEVALVPHKSPISQSDRVFFHTLYDENASCHLAIGRAYSLCLEGGTQMSQRELEENGCNQSLTHVDFMMGAADLDIDGYTADGTVEPVFRNGNWAF